MKTNKQVHGTQDRKPSFYEENGDTVYLRTNIARTTVKDDSGERAEWVYDEDVLSRTEFQSMQQGRLMDGEWDDALRRAERMLLYRNADDMISKYSTDAVDDAMKQKWIDYKAAVRATQNASGYPKTASYPEPPE